MPCTLRRLEVWQVTPQNCPRCRKLPLPKSAKISRHQACTILAVSSLLSHKSCSRKQVRLTRKTSQPNSAAGKVLNKLIKVENTCLGPVPRRPSLPSKKSKSKFKKVKMSEKSDSDSDSSVIILTDDEDDKPIRQRLVEYREGIGKVIAQKIEEDKTQSKQEGFVVKVESFHLKSEDDIILKKHEPCDDVLANPITKLNDDKHEDPGRKEALTMLKEEEVDSKGTSKVLCLDTRSRDVGRMKEDGGESDSDEEEQFEKHFKQDLNFVMAKFMVKKKKVGFVCDTNNNQGPFERKMRRILDQADILMIKKSLDDGGEIFKPRDLDLKKLLPKPAPPPPSLPIVPTNLLKSAPDGLSDDDSPNASQTVPVTDENVPQMPVVFDNLDFEKVIPEKKASAVKTFKFKPYQPPSRPKKLPPPIPKVLKPAVVFPSIKTKSFKIPRAAKPKQPKWVTNGSLWQWALTVDDTGEYSRTEKERKKVPWASLVVKRACEEFQLWLVRGTFSEGDDCQWDFQEVDAMEKSKMDREEVKRRREDMMWREKILDKMLGLGAQAEQLISTRDPLGLDERDSGTGSLEVGNLTSRTVTGSDATEEFVENELNVSQQSLVTHIRTPTHTFCMDEEESEGTDCMDEHNEPANIDENVQKLTKSLISSDIEHNLASLPALDVLSCAGLRGPPLTSTPTPHQLPSQLFPSTDVLQPYPSPPPSMAPSVGFAFTRLPPGQPKVTTSNTSQPGPIAAQVEASPNPVPVTASKSMSALSGLVSTKKTRLKLF